MTKTALLIACIAVGRLLVGGAYVDPGTPIDLPEEDFNEQLELGNVRLPGSFDADRAEAAATAEAERLAAEAAATAEAELLAAQQASAGSDKPARKRS
jgi:hypothetical protein